MLVCQLFLVPLKCFSHIFIIVMKVYLNSWELIYTLIVIINFCRNFVDVNFFFYLKRVCKGWGLQHYYWLIIIAFQGHCIAFFFVVIKGFLLSGLLLYTVCGKQHVRFFFFFNKRKYFPNFLNTLVSVPFLLLSHFHCLSSSHTHTQQGYV